MDSRKGRQACFVVKEQQSTTSLRQLSASMFVFILKSHFITQVSVRSQVAENYCDIV